MPIITFTNRDILRGTIVEPAWYRVLINSVGEGTPAKDQSKGPSTNYPIEGTILFNGDTGDTKYADVPLEWMFNSKAMGFATGFVRALGSEPVAGARMELKAAEGEQIDVFVETGSWNNRPKNEINHKYRVPKSDVHAVKAE